jgi:hypothetical protein
MVIASVLVIMVVVIIVDGCVYAYVVGVADDKGDGLTGERMSLPSIGFDRAVTVHGRGDIKS